MNAPLTKHDKLSGRDKLAGKKGFSPGRSYDKGWALLMKRTDDEIFESLKRRMEKNDADGVKGVGWLAGHYQKRPAKQLD